MKILTLVFLICLASAAHTGGFKPLGLSTVGIEAMQILIVGDTVKFRDCEKCPMRRMTAAPDLRIGLPDGLIVPPKTPRSGTVVYRPKDDLVVGVDYW